MEIKEIKISHLTVPVWFVKKDNSTVACKIVFRNEGTRNFKNKPAIPQLCMESLRFGAGPYDGPQFMTKCQENGIDMFCRASRDTIVISLYMTPDKFKLAMELAKFAAVKAKLPRKEFRILKSDLLKFYERSSGLPESKVFDKLDELRLLPTHPYYRQNDEEFLTSIDQTEHSDILKAYDHVLDPKDAVVVVAGNISEDLLSQEFEKFFGALAKTKHNPFPHQKNKKQVL